MKDGSIDGLIWSGGLPTPQITDITTSLKDKVKLHRHHAAAAAS